MGTLRPTNWSVVVAGKWNRAILTPKGIGRYVFDLDKDQGVSVLIPLDAYPVPIVKHPGLELNAKADQNKLVIGLREEKFELFKHAADAARNAIKSLPKTPLSAAGCNVNFRSDESVDCIAKLLENEYADDSVVNAGMVTKSRSIGRSAGFDDTLLRMGIKAEVDGNCSVEFNFHKEETNEEMLRQWLDDIPGRIEDVVRSILRNVGVENEIDWGEANVE